MRLSIIIPVYNEEKLICRTIEKVMSSDTLGLEKEIIVIDDGSTDKTAEQVESQKSKVESRGRRIIFIKKKKNQGKGAALKVGFQKSTGDILLVQDADCEYSVSDYPALLSPFLKKKADVVYGTRNKLRSKYHTRYSYFSFYIGGILLTWFINLLFRTKLSDQATGYKLFSKKTKHILLEPQEDGFSYEVSITSLLAKRGFHIYEVPIHYKPRTLREGKKINAFDFVKSVLVALHYRIIR